MLSLYLLLPQAAVLFFCLLSPNQEVAFVVAAAYTAISSLGAGLYVTEPNMWQPIRWIEWFSMLKYPYQGRPIESYRQTVREKGGSLTIC